MLQNRLANTFFGILVSSLFISCATPITHIPGHTTVRFFDLTKYTELGFLITPEETYTGKYDSIGSLTIERMPEAHKVTGKKGSLNVGAQPGGQTTQYVYLPHIQWKAGLIMQKELDETMDELYRKAKGNGADAIVNFKFEEIRQERVVDTDKIIVLVGVRVSGFAIKRLD